MRARTEHPKDQADVLHRFCNSIHGTKARQTVIAVAILQNLGISAILLELFMFHFYYIIWNAFFLHVWQEQWSVKKGNRNILCISYIFIIIYLFFKYDKRSSSFPKEEKSNQTMTSNLLLFMFFFVFFII